MVDGGRWCWTGWGGGGGLGGRAEGAGCGQGAVGTVMEKSNNFRSIDSS